MNLNDLFEANVIDTQSQPRQALDVAGGRKKHLQYREEKVKKKLDRVIVALSGKESEIFTKLANEYKSIDELQKQIDIKRDSLNLDAKNHLLQYFDANDEVLTRVVETVSLTLTMSKRVINTKDEVDFEGFFKELLVLLPEIQDKLKILLQTYTTTTNKETSPRLTVKTNDPEPDSADLAKKAKKALKKESMIFESEGFWSRIKEAGSHLLRVFKKWGNNYDKKLAFLAQKFNEFAVNESLAHDRRPDDTTIILKSPHYYVEKAGVGTIITRMEDGKEIFLQPGDDENSFLSELGSLPEHMDDDKIDHWLAQHFDAAERSDKWISQLNEGKKMPSNMDRHDMHEQVQELHSCAHKAYQQLLKLEMVALRVASSNEPGTDIDFERMMADRFKELSFEAEALADKIKKIEFDIDDTLQEQPKSPSPSPAPKQEESVELKVAPVPTPIAAQTTGRALKEGLNDDTSEAMSHLANKIAKLAREGKLNSQDHKMLSHMLFHKEKMISKSSVFEILSSLQEMGTEQYNATKELVAKLAQ